MKKVISSVLLCAGFAVQAADMPLNITNKAEPQQYWITMGQDALPELKQVGGKEFMMTSVVSHNSKKVSIAQINEGQLSSLSRLMHDNHNRCGGYMVHDSLQSAMIEQQQTVVPAPFVASALTEATTVNALLPNLAKENIVDTITYLSTNFNNRYYTTSGGSNASDGLKARWEAIVAGKSWASVNQIAHSGYGQKSVEVILTGSEKPEDIIVIGGHLDSTIGSTSESSTAPGADDDASGIATLTEVLRVYVENNVQPKRTVKFYAYAAEEVGLRGSGDIANKAASDGDNVVGVMQLDMTNYDGSVNDITMMTDYASSTQNSYIASLLDTYLPGISYGYDSCGYGCSDHASWTSAGFPASMPFETRMSEYNPRIHSTTDTLANMDSTGAKALKFAQMALAYVVEMAADTTPPPPPPPAGVLIKGESVTIAGETGSETHWEFDATGANSSVTFNMNGGSGDADLYVKLGSAPTSSSYDCRPYASGNTEACNFTAAGTYYVMVNGYSAYSGISLVADHDGGGTPPGGGDSGSKSDILIVAKGWDRTTVDIPAGASNFVVTTTGGTGNVKLYLRQGSNPTTRVYDCRSKVSGNEESCTIASPGEGAWVIGIKANKTATSGLNMAWSYE